MGDVAQILSGEAAKAPPPPPPPPPPRSYRPSRTTQHHGTLPRDAMDVLTDAKRRRRGAGGGGGGGDDASAALPPIVPTLNVPQWSRLDPDAPRSASDPAPSSKAPPATATTTEAPTGPAAGGAVDLGEVGAAPAATAAGAAGGAAKAPDVGADGGAAKSPAASTAPPLLPAKPSVPREAIAVRVGNRMIVSTKPARRWIWAPFSSSARSDGAQFRHWVRAGVEYPDYPYARFDVHLEPLMYSDEEYDRYFADEEEGAAGGVWTKGETDRLLELATALELRWAVVHDRWVGIFGPDSRNAEDLMYRYYHVGAMLNRARVAEAARAEAAKAAATLAQQQQAGGAVALAAAAGGGAPGAAPSAEAATAAASVAAAAASLGGAAAADPSRLADVRAAMTAVAASDPRFQPLVTDPTTGTSNKDVFDLAAERERRRRLDDLWFRPKEDEREEEALRKELKLVEAQIRRLKKSGGHAVKTAGAAPAPIGPVGAAVAGAGAGAAGSAAASGAASRSISPVPGGPPSADPAALAHAFASTAPVPTAGTPYLQSGRLAQPATGGPAGLNKTLLRKMEQVLRELGAPERPVPTQRCCDVYDAVRTGTLTLIALQKMALRRESDTNVLRNRLARQTGGKSELLKRARATAAAAAHSAAETKAGAAAATAAAAPSAEAAALPPAPGGGGKKSKGAGKSKKGSKKSSSTSVHAGATASPGDHTSAAGRIGGGTTAKKKKGTKRKKSAAAAPAPAAVAAALARAPGPIPASGVAPPPAPSTTMTTAAAAAAVAAAHKAAAIRASLGVAVAVPPATAPAAKAPPKKKSKKSSSIPTVAATAGN